MTAPFSLITPARNEEQFIERVLQSVVAQTVLPLRWIIVDDSSTDGTAALVERWCRSYSFIQLLRLNQNSDRNFGNKARAFEHGWDLVRSCATRYVGNLDADISLEPDYYERVISEFEADPALGICGGMVFSSIDGRFVSQDVALDSVAGAVQLFRRPCFEAVGGYRALPSGGIDAVAEITARMKGWKVRTLPQLRVLEHRRTGSAAKGVIAAGIQEGRRFHSLGYSASFFFARCLYRALKRSGHPFYCAATLFGFARARLRGEPVVLDGATVQFLRAEQRTKLLHWRTQIKPEPRQVQRVNVPPRSEAAFL